MLDSQKSKSATNSDRNSKIQNRKIRVLLWDIDGTLLRSTKQGDFREYFAPAMREVYGGTGTLDKMSVSGMTDSQIAFEALKDENFTTEKIFEKMADFIKSLGENMARFVGNYDKPYEILPGAHEILEATSQNQHFVNALLTGNFSGGAEIKLKQVGLWEYFENQPNTFGEHSHDRRKLAELALRNIKEYFRVDLTNKQVIVIGDTPNDIDCAKSIGAKVIAVATGRNYPANELQTFKPDCVLENLSDTGKVLQILETV